MLRPESIARRRAWQFLGLGLLLTLLATLAYQQAYDSAQRARFNAYADRATARLGDRVLSYERGLRGTRSALLPLGPTAVTADHFRTIGRSRDIVREFPGSLGIGFVQRVPPDGLARFLQEAARQGRADLNIHQIGDNPGDRFIVKHIEPEAENISALGFDVASEDRRRSTIRQAIQTGEATLSPPITLVQAGGKVNRGFILLLPVYPGWQTPASVPERESAALGLVHMPLLIDEVVDRLDMTQDGVSLILTDVGEEMATPFLGSRQTPPPYPQLATERQIEVFGRQWQIEYRAEPDYVASQPTNHTLTVATLGALLSLLIAALIHHEVLARQRLASSNERFVRLISSAPTALAMFDDQLCYLAVSQRWLDDFRLNDREVIGRCHFDLFPHLPAPWRAYFERALAGETISRLNEQLARRDGSVRWLNWAMAPWHHFDGSRGGIVVFAEDATEQHRLVSELEQARDAAETANRAKTLFLGNMSHEMRTPLHQLGGILSLFQRGGVSEKQQRWLDMMRTSLRRLETVIGGILTLVDLEAKSVSVSPKPIDLHLLMSGIIDMLRDRANEKQIGLSLTVNQLPPGLLGDAGHIRTILACYINNALTYSRAGNVAVIIDCIREDDHSAEVRLTVRDQGIGIPPDKIDRLFETFEQVDNSHTRPYGGTGTGLAIVRKLARLMNGDAGCTSVEGEGSNFWATFVLIKASALPQPSNGEDFSI